MVKFPNMNEWKKYFKKHTKLLLSGIGLGLVGAWLYLQQVPREAIVVATGRAGELGALTGSPEAKVYTAFVLTGLMAALIVSNYVGKK